MWSHPQHLGLLGRGWEWKRVCFLTGRPPSLLHSSQEDPKGFKHTQPREWLFGPLRSCLWFLQILFVFQTSWALTYAHVRLIPNSPLSGSRSTLLGITVLFVSMSNKESLAYSLYTVVEPPGESRHCYLCIFRRSGHIWGSSILLPSKWITHWRLHQSWISKKTMTLSKAKHSQYPSDR